MNKKLLVFLSGLIAFTIIFSACSSPTIKNELLEKPLNEILDVIYKQADLENSKLGYTPVTNENMEYYIGTANIEMLEGMASEPLMTSVAHSIVLIRVADGSNIEKIKDDIKKNVNPRKWICVGVEEEDVVVENVDNLIILIMEDRSEDFYKAFTEVLK